MYDNQKLKRVIQIVLTSLTVKMKGINSYYQILYLVFIFGFVWNLCTNKGIRYLCTYFRTTKKAFSSICIDVVEDSKTQMCLLRMFIDSVVLIPVLEELFFRGMLQTLLNSYLGHLCGGIFTSLIFGIIYYIFKYQTFIVLQNIILGLILSYLTQFDLLQAICFHAGFNLYGLYLWYKQLKFSKYQTKMRKDEIVETILCSANPSKQFQNFSIHRYIFAFRMLSSIMRL